MTGKGTCEQILKTQQITEKARQDCIALHRVAQGCILSSLFYNIYSEHIMRKELDKWGGGITIGGRKISNLR